MPTPSSEGAASTAPDAALVADAGDAGPIAAESSDTGEPLESKGAPVPEPVSISLVPIGGAKLDKPVQVVARGTSLLVAEQAGRVLWLARDASGPPSVALDLSARVIVGSEAGLLGIAVHPSFDDNGRLFVSYVAPSPDGDPDRGLSVVARYESHDGGVTFDADSEKTIFTIVQPALSHNGGTIQFGNEGYLYLSLGDGAWGDDPFHTAQDPKSGLGSILRIDVDSGEPYAIPADNPFVATGGRPEVYAIGFRNPFRFSFDRDTGDLWAGDVGESEREEIDRVINGGDYGWPIREGKKCFADTECSSAGFIDPVVDHGRDDAQAIIGGVVYHGDRVPEITGKYVYGDWVLGHLFAFSPNDATPEPVRLADTKHTPYPTSFALDADGEIILSSYDGSLYRIEPADPAAQ